MIGGGLGVVALLLLLWACWLSTMPAPGDDDHTTTTDQEDQA